MRRKIIIGISAVSVLILIALAFLLQTKPGVLKKDNRTLCIEYNLVFGKEGIGPRQAELYLAVQHDAYPGVKVLWPVNVGTNSMPNGYRAIPFTAEQGDTLKFSLLDDDDLTSQEEKMLLEAAKAAGSVIIECANVYFILQTRMPLPRGATPSVQMLLQLGAREVIRTSHEHPWDDYGSQDYIVQEKIPENSSDANPITIASDLPVVPFFKIKRLDVKVYQPKIRKL